MAMPPILPKFSPHLSPFSYLTNPPRKSHPYSHSSLSPRHPFLPRLRHLTLTKAIDIRPSTNSPQERESSTEDPEVNETETSFLLEVNGMMCGACVTRVRNVLTADEGVESAVVNMVTETAAVRVRRGAAAAAVAEEVVGRLRESGFEARRRERVSGVGERVRRWREMAAKKEEMMAKSREKVVVAWTLVALCCGSHASHILHSLGIHFAHGGIWDVLHNSYVRGALALGALLGPGRG